MAERLRGEDFDRCYCSDLGRAIDTYRFVSRALGPIPTLFDHRIRERYFGSLQGQVFPDNYDETLFPPETETIESVATRLEDFLGTLIGHHGESDDRILIVSHGFTIKILMAIVRNLPMSQYNEVAEILNTSVSVCTYLPEGRGWCEELFNDTSHLK